MHSHQDLYVKHTCMIENSILYIQLICHVCFIYGITLVRIRKMHFLAQGNSGDIFILYYLLRIS